MKHEQLIASGLHECASDCQRRPDVAPTVYPDHYQAGSRTEGKRELYVDRLGRKRWRPAVKP